MTLEQRIVALVQAVGSDIKTLWPWAGKTAPAGAVVGTTDPQAVSNKTFSAAVFSGSLSLSTQTATISTSTYTVNFATQSIWRVTLSANTMITPSFPGPGRYSLNLVQDGTGGRTVAFSGVTWAGAASMPAINSAANGITAVTFLYDGTTAIASLVKVGVA